MRLLTLLLMAIAICLFSAAASAQVIHGCIKSNGTLKVVPAPGTCGNNEAPISWNVQGPPGADGADGQDGADGAPGSDAEVLHVFDALGTDVGVFMNRDGVGYEIFLPGPDLIVMLNADNAALRTTAPSLIENLLYTTTDCSGQAYVRADNVFPRMALFHPGPGLDDWAVVEAGSTPEIIVWQTESGNFGIGNPTCRFQGAITTNVVPATILPSGIFDYLDYLDDLVPPLYTAPAP